MTPRLTITEFDGTLAARLAALRGDDGVSFYWLGQAGFLVTAAGKRIVIDPYLSDSLAEKYRGKTFPHERLMPPPIAIAELGPVDLVLVTHQHTDHMDPATLAPLAAQNPGCRFVVPRAAMDEALKRIGTDASRLIGMDAGERFSPFAGCTVTATRAAHEELQRTPEGLHRFLGYVLDLGGTRLFHSGDTVPFEGQEAEVSVLAPQVALLPVNGRRPELTAAGIAGNLTLEEAHALAREVGAAEMIAHHYGMFAFNTLEPTRIDSFACDGCTPRVHRARTGLEYRLS
jgi:L-ascorbate metabolism protein UlaG (beta-lactamase superfamily)